MRSRYTTSRVRATLAVLLAIAEAGASARRSATSDAEATFGIDFIECSNLPNVDNGSRTEDSDFLGPEHTERLSGQLQLREGGYTGILG